MWTGEEKRKDLRRKEDESTVVVSAIEYKKGDMAYAQDTIRNRRKYNDRRAIVSIEQTRKFMEEALDVSLQPYQVEALTKFIRGYK